MDKKQEAKELLKEYNQEHISKFIDEIDEEKAEELIEQNIGNFIVNLSDDKKKDLIRSMYPKAVNKGTQNSENPTNFIGFSHRNIHDLAVDFRALKF